MKKPGTFLLVLAAIMACSIPTAAVLAAPADCRVAEAGRFPIYANQGSWSADGSTLLLVDPVHDQIHLYEETKGRFKGLLRAPAAVGQDAFFPLSVRTFGGNLVVEAYPQQLLFLGKQSQLLEVRQPLRDLRMAMSDGTTAVQDGMSGISLESLFLWNFAGEDVVGCGDMKHADGEWKTGVVRFAIDSPKKLETYAVSDFSDPRWIFCRLGFPYIASIGDTAYILLFDEQPGIYVSEPGDQQLRRLPYDLALAGGAVRLPEFTSPKEFAYTMAQVERQTMPVGLYSWDASLYVLYRRPDGSGGTRWTLHEVDPVTGRRRGQPAAIDSSASHLMLIPGETWALVEKGPVVQLGTQRTQRIRFLASQDIPRPLHGKLCGE